MRCTICKNSTEELKSLPLYVVGSEGVELCHACEMTLVEFIRKMISLASYCYLRGQKEARKEEIK